MPALSNARWERFAQDLAAGKSSTDAYVGAGYSKQGARQSAARLLANADIQLRVAELLEKRAQFHEAATDRAITKLAITKEAVLQELAKIAFADISKAVQWRGNLVRIQDNEEGGDILLIKETFSNHVRLIDSDKLDPGIAAAIAEVSQTAAGALRIKFHDKQAALVNLGKHMGLFIDRVEHGKPGDFTGLADPELAERMKQEAAALGYASTEEFTAALAAGQVVVTGNETEH
jgi:phage terminase small subunit